MKNEPRINTWPGFWALVEREIYRFLKFIMQTIVPPVITTMLFIVVFGYSLGQGVEQIHGYSYALYILPGVVIMSVITNAYVNTSTSLFTAKLDKSIEVILTAPITSLQIAAGFIIGGIVRGVLIGGVILGIARLMIDFPVHHGFLLVFDLIAISILSSSLGAIAALWGEKWDHIAFFATFIITPFTYLGGVFYSIAMLPPFWQKVSLFNPLLYLIEGFRFAVLGVSDLSPWVTGGVMVAVALVLTTTTAVLFRRGYKLIV